jgi:phage FluMu protein Com
MKNISHTISPQSIALANQVRLEQLKNGYVSVKCPKCHEHLEIRTTPKGERTIISCPCGYVRNIEINL